ncbi:MAG: FliM/FliN family flagellar motor switch protein [Blastomonas sp.]
MSKVTHPGSASEAPARNAEHSFARQDSDQKTVVPVLRRVSRTLATLLRGSMEQISAAKVKVDAPEPEFTVYESWVGQQKDLVSLCTYQLAPMKGRILLKFDPAMISAMVDAFFGGAIREGTMVKKDFTQTDLRLIDRLAKILAGNIGIAWSEFGSFACHYAGHASSTDAVRIASPSARIVLQRYRLTFPDNIRFELEMLYPLDALHSVDQIVSSASEGDERSGDPVWRDKLAQAVVDVHLPARSVLARPTLTLPQLAELKVGDIIPIPPARNLPLLIGERVFARGSLGEQNGLAAFKIEHIEKG